MKSFLQILALEIRLNLRQGTDLLVPAGFFGMILLLFPLSLGGDAMLLRQIAPAVIWIALLLSGLLSLDRLFARDFDLGRLDLYRQYGLSAFSLLCLKACLHWGLTLLPLIFLTLTAGLFFNLPLPILKTLLATMLIATPALSFLSCFGACLTIGARNSGILLVLLILPFFIPTLIFALGAVDATRFELPTMASFSFLFGYGLILLLLSILGGTIALQKNTQ